MNPTTTERELRARRHMVDFWQRSIDAAMPEIRRLEALLEQYRAKQRAAYLPGDEPTN